MLAHARQHRLNHGNRAEHVDLEQGLDLVQRRLLDRTGEPIARIVHEHVDLAKTLLDLVDRFTDVVKMCDVQKNRHGKLRISLREDLRIAFGPHCADNPISALQDRFSQVFSQTFSHACY